MLTNISLGSVLQTVGCIGGTLVSKFWTAARKELQSKAAERAAEREREREVNLSPDSLDSQSWVLLLLPVNSSAKERRAAKSERLNDYCWDAYTHLKMKMRSVCITSLLFLFFFFLFFFSSPLFFSSSLLYVLDATTFLHLTDTHWTLGCSE